MDLSAPGLLALGPLAGLALYLLERWRRRPPALVVADVTLFRATPEAARAARASRRRAGLRLLLAVLSVHALALAASGPTRPGAGPGPVLVDLVLDRGVSAGVVEADGRPRLDLLRAQLEAVLDHLRADDRVRLHLAPPDEAGARTCAPDAARALLRAVEATAAEADLAGPLARLAPAARAAGRPPPFAATDRAVALPPDVAPHAVLAFAGAPRPDRGIVSLAESEGRLHVALASYGAPGPVRVLVRGVGGAGAGGRDDDLLGVAEAVLPPDGLALASVALAASATAVAVQLEARAGGPDALAADDAAFAAREPVRRRRVGIAGGPGPARRALGAVPGVDVVDFAGPPGMTGPPGPAEQARLDLLVLVAREPPLGLAVATVVVAPAGVAPGERGPGGLLRGGAARAFPHTIAALAREPAHVPWTVAPPPGLGGEPVLLAGDAPLVVVSGAGRGLRAFVGAELAGSPGDWPHTTAFPVFWAELLELAAPGGGGGPLAAHVAGVTRAVAGRVVRPLGVALLDLGEGVRLGTVAAVPDAVARPAAPRSFGAADLARIDAARPAAPARPLAAVFVVLGLGLALAAWTPARPGAGQPGAGRAPA